MNEILETRYGKVEVLITKVIQKNKVNNPDIIIGGERLNKSSTLINTLFGNKDRYLISDVIYSTNKDVLDIYKLCVNWLSINNPSISVKFFNFIWFSYYSDK